MINKGLKKQYRVLVERDEDGFLVATVPALPGCHTQAKNLSELSSRVRDAIYLCLNVAKNDANYKKKIQRFSYEPSFVGLETISV